MTGHDGVSIGQHRHVATIGRTDLKQVPARNDLKDRKPRRIAATFLLLNDRYMTCVMGKREIYYWKVGIVGYQTDAPLQEVENEQFPICGNTTQEFLRVRKFEALGR